MSRPMSPTELADALDLRGFANLRAFQAWWGLPTTGQLDGPTQRTLEAPRICNLPDRMALGSQVCKWTKRHLRWCVTGTVPGMTLGQVIEAMTTAWNLWSAVCGITHEPTDDPRQADVRHDTGRIDGRGSTLAWSELPCGADQQRKQLYDVGEPWVLSQNPPQGYFSLVIVAAHEIGHVLGLDHTSVNGQLLNPIYNPVVGKPQASWDIPQVVNRYGQPAPKTPTPTPPGTPGDWGAAGMAFFPDAGIVVWQGKTGKVVWQ